MDTVWAWNVDGEQWMVVSHLVMVMKLQSFVTNDDYWTKCYCSTYSLYNNPFQEQGATISAANHELYLDLPKGHHSSLFVLVYQHV